MKTIINKLRYTLLLGFIALAALGTSLNAAAESLTVCDVNTTNNSYVPFYGYYHDVAGTTVQVIYPASMLTDMDDGTITSVKFYPSTALKFSGGLITVTMGMTDESSYSSNNAMTISGTTVTTTFVPNTNMSEVELTFSPGLVYTPGKNLIIQTVVTTAGTCDSYGNRTNFVGCTQQYNCAYNSRNSDSSTRTFLPKATFGYEPATNDPTITADPLTIDFEAIPGGSDSKTVTVRGRNLTGNINVSGPSGGIFSVSPSSFAPSNGIVDNQLLTITYTPNELGTHSAIVTLSSAGADPVTITLNGSCDRKATICDGTDKNGNLPIYGYYIDNYQINQMIYPESLLSDLIGKDLTSMTFYTEGNIHPDLETSTWTIKLGTTDETVFASSLANSTRLVPNDITTVTPEQGYIVTSGINTMTIVFDTPFPYNGGNLLVDFQSTAHTSDYEATNFYGVNQNSDHNTGFHSYGSSATPGDNGHYTGGNVDAFLPKVTFTYEESTPITNGTVTPDAVDFGTVVVGETATQTVAIKNTGNQPFTPVIDVTGLPEGITVSPTTSGELAGHGTLNLTVTFTPTADGEYSGSFTVTIPIPDGEDLVFTVDVTGSAYVVSSKLTSNMVEIPVYKSDVNPNAPNGYPYIFSQTDVQDDIDMSLSYDDVSDGVSILVKSDEQITGYDLKHKPANGNTWSSVGTAAHQGNSYVAGETTMNFGQDETEMWFPMDDQQEEAYDYVPVTVANSIVAGGTQGNTYGAPIRTKNVDNVTLEVIVGGSKSDQRPYGSWVTDGVDYCVYTPVIMISSEALNGDTHIPYMFRAWLLSDDVIYDFERNTTNGHIVGTDPIDLPHCLGTFEVDQTAIGQTTFTIGRDWVEPEGEDNPNDWNTKLENAFGAPSENADIRIVVRAYYTRATRDGNGYAFSEGEGDGDGISTWVMELNSDRQVVGVTYVNPMGMTSDRPFEGMNIIVTRYSDGSCRTSKVMF